MKKMFQRGTIVLIGLLGFFLLQPSIVFGQTFVSDDAGVLSKEAINQIDALNKEGFQSLTGSPEYAVITITSLDGQSIEDKTTSLFNEYGLGNPQDNNGLLFLFAIDDREFRLGYGDGLTYVFSDLSEDDLVDEDAKDALRDEDYDTAILAASNEVYQRMKEADETIGLGTIYREGNQMLADRRNQEAEATKQMWLNIGKIISGVVVAGSVGLVGIIGWRHRKTKQRFDDQLPLPAHLLEDQHFRKKEFSKWASTRRNYQFYNKYQTVEDCQQAFTQYLSTFYVPVKLSTITGLSTADQRVIQHAFTTPAIGAYFSSLFLMKKITLKHFAQMISTHQDTLKTYEAQLVREVSERMVDYDLTEAIMPENLVLVEAYRAEIAKQAKDEIRRRNENNRYLAKLVTEQATYPDLVQTIPQEISEIIGLVKTEALFKVDLEQVYQQHPDLAGKLSAFDTSDQAAVLNHARQEYDPQGMNRALFFVMMNNHVTHQEQVIADSQSSNNDFGGFSGGGSSGGGVSGSW